jgi:oxygen-independent coproporphyrinogen-3 oxidase
VISTEPGPRDPAGEALAVYIHWPFCRSKCPYCDFNSHVRARIDAARWERALLADLAQQAALAPERAVTSIFFGGGTPSLMPPDTVAALIGRIKELWPAASGLEITLEANPNSAEAERFAAFAGAGVNRLSLGVQALDRAALRFLGRAHDRAEAVDAIGAAREAFPRYSFDLIYARPGQTRAAWEAELDEALTLAGEHLSLYQLTIEPGTAFGSRAARGARLAADEDDAAAMYEATQRQLRAAGLPAYEISNHARPGGECRHNLAYWRYQDYLGIGPGAHGRVTRNGGKLATRQVRGPEAWLAAIESAGAALEETAAVSRSEAVEEMVMMGLRLVEGVARQRLEALAEQTVERLFGAALARLTDGGFLTLDAERLAATDAGRQRLDAVLAALFA